ERRPSGGRAKTIRWASEDHQVGERRPSGGRAKTIRWASEDHQVGERRPSGARAGAAAFYDLLNARKRSAVLDFGDARDAALLAALLASADMLIESARPRALAQLGVDAEAFVAARAGRVWLSITGYGRGDPAPGRVAFGDDAAVAAGA